MGHAPAAASAEGHGFEVIHSFSQPCRSISGQSSLIQGNDGQLYGTSQYGGSKCWGSVYRLSLNGKLKVLHSFVKHPASQGYIPIGLTLGTDGNFYGVNYSGGRDGFGTAFQVTPSGKATVLHGFAGKKFGNWPGERLLQASDGNFYGTTSGGVYEKCCATAFRLSPAGEHAVLHNFEKGSNPSRLIEGLDGSFYGTTSGGGTHGGGTLFRLQSDGSFMVLHDFGAEAKDSLIPRGGLLQAADGHLYGTSEEGGAAGQGTVFRATTDGKVTVLHSFAGKPSDGANPFAALIQVANGDFYGTTSWGGPNDSGTVFRVRADGSFNILHEFVGSSDGFSPEEPLMQASDGMLYGTTTWGGANKVGTVFRIEAK
jgi:uncharacterized repeat protein (TIGR03803 family)